METSTKHSQKKNRMGMLRKPKFVTRMMKPWNERFHVMTTKDNKKLHLYYKELFGKPSHIKQEEVLLHDKGVEQNMFSTSYAPMSSTVASKTMRKSQSQEHFQEAMTKEQQWVGNFAIMGSKNNDIVHRHFQEYFDRPVEYDNQGYKTGIKQFGEVYDSLSPSKYNQFSKTMHHKSISSFKHQNLWATTKASPMPTIEVEDEEGEAKKIANSPTIKNAIIHQRKKIIFK
jgi:hypothetical protein